jgi:hypothetical protein
MSDEKIDLGFFGKSLHDGLLSILEKWRPPKMATELECRNALFERLRKFLPDKAKIEKEYRHEGTTLDLYVRCEDTKRFYLTARSCRDLGSVLLLEGRPPSSSSAPFYEQVRQIPFRSGE